MARQFLLFVAGLIAVAALLVAGAVHYVTGVPGRSYAGPLPPLSPDERDLVVKLKRHIEAIASREHNIAHYDELEKSARYIETALESYGYAVNKQEFDVDDFRSGIRRVRNID